MLLVMLFLDGWLSFLFSLQWGGLTSNIQRHLLIEFGLMIGLYLMCYILYSWHKRWPWKEHLLVGGSQFVSLLFVVLVCEFTFEFSVANWMNYITLSWIVLVLYVVSYLVDWLFASAYQRKYFNMK